MHEYIIYVTSMFNMYLKCTISFKKKNLGMWTHKGNITYYYALLALNGAVWFIFM